MKKYKIYFQGSMIMMIQAENAKKARSLFNRCIECVKED